jgi:hypothetical protein
MTGAPKDPAEQFRDLLDQHGHGFQWSVASHLKQLTERRVIPWAVDGEEVPVVVRNRTTKIDIVLRRRGEDQVRMYLVCECKRTNPAFWWCFIRRSRGQMLPLLTPRAVVADRLHALPIQPMKEAKLQPDRLFHDLRRSAARNLRHSGASETEAMGVTGHKTPSMFRRYSIVTDEEAAAALLKQDAFLALQDRKRECA